MSNDKHQALRDALNTGPTEGEWDHCEYGVGEHVVFAKKPGGDEPAVLFINEDMRYSTESMEQQGIDAAYVAAANPEAIRALLADHDRMRAALQNIADTPTCECCGGSLEGAVYAAERTLKECEQ